MGRIRSTLLICGILLGMIAAPDPSGEPQPKEALSTIESVYPGLASGALTHARLDDLPDGTLLRAGSLEITDDELNGEIAKVPRTLRMQLKKNAFFLLEQVATKKLLLQAASQHAGKTEAGLSDKSDTDIIQAYLRQVVNQVTVEEAEVTGFYQKNSDMFGGATLEQVKGQLKQYMLQQKRQEAISDYIRSLGQRVPIVVSASWVKEQAALARDNPVDKARMSGKPSIVDFGATGCRPCDMMAPILVDLKKRYEGKLNVLFVHVRTEQILAARYGIQGIPVQVFFDKEGKEVFRHTGFFPQDEIEKKLKAMGVR